MFALIVFNFKGGEQYELPYDGRSIDKMMEMVDRGRRENLNFSQAIEEPTDLGKTFNDIASVELVY